MQIGLNTELIIIQQVQLTRSN